MSLILPQTMTATEISAFGGPEVLKTCQRPLPRIGNKDVLIKVVAAGINRPDIMQRQGLYPAPKGASDIPGLEVSGIIVATGEDVEGWTVGEAVCALVSGGGYAQYCTAPASQCMPVPHGMALQAAAALPETFFTVWSNVFDRAALKKGETFFVHGGTSGIGTTAIQMAKAFGARVITTSGSMEKCDQCRALGADLAINYKSQDFVAEVKEFTGGQGVDVLLDMIAGDYADRNLQIMGIEGRIVIIAVQHGPKATLNLLPIMLKRLTFTGSTLRAREESFKEQIAQNLLEKVWPLLAAGQIRPIISTVFAAEQATEAHAALESGENMGKILLSFDEK